MRKERVIPMDPAIRKVVAVLAAALIVVIGVIIMAGSAKDRAAVTTGDDIKHQESPKTEESQADAAGSAEETPTNEAKASEADVTPEAQTDENAQGNEMYEGALAGLSEEEIAKMALAEEGSAARTETTGAEDAVD